MKGSLLRQISLCFVLLVSTLIVGCCINIGCSGCNWAKYERIVELSEPFAAGSTFAKQSHNGSITVEGTDTPDCNVTAKITGRAATEEGARKIAEQTELKLESFGNKLTAKIKRPSFALRKSVSVSFDVKLPDRSGLELITHNGPLKISNINGQIDAVTHNGSAITENTSGIIKLTTHNGKIKCRDISGDIELKTHNGRVIAQYDSEAPAVCNVSMITHNGGIDFTAPANFSAKVEAKTHNGSITTDLPIMVLGKVSKRKLTGTIGSGEGTLHLETHNGSISIK